MRAVADYGEFNILTGKISDSVALEQMALTPSTRLGIFDAEQLPELIEFCKDNPQYHIISVVKNFVHVNKTRQDAIMFYLGNGDKSEDIVFDSSLHIGFNL